MNEHQGPRRPGGRRAGLFDAAGAPAQATTVPQPGTPAIDAPAGPAAAGAAAGSGPTAAAAAPLVSHWGAAEEGPAPRGAATGGETGEAGAPDFSAQAEGPSCTGRYVYRDGQEAPRHATSANVLLIEDLAGKPWGIGYLRVAMQHDGASLHSFQTSFSRSAGSFGSRLQQAAISVQASPAPTGAGAALAVRLSFHVELAEGPDPSAFRGSVLIDGAGQLRRESFEITSGAPKLGGYGDGFRVELAR